MGLLLKASGEIFFSAELEGFRDLQDIRELVLS